MDVEEEKNREVKPSYAKIAASRKASFLDHPNFKILKDTDWICPSCNFHNRKFRACCLKCTTKDNTDNMDSTVPPPRPMAEFNLLKYKLSSTSVDTKLRNMLNHHKESTWSKNYCMVNERCVDTKARRTQQEVVEKLYEHCQFGADIAADDIPAAPHKQMDNFFYFTLADDGLTNLTTICNGLSDNNINGFINPPYNNLRTWITSIANTMDCLSTSLKNFKLWAILPGNSELCKIDNVLFLDPNFGLLRKYMTDLIEIRNSHFYCINEDGTINDFPNFPKPLFAVLLNSGGSFQDIKRESWDLANSTNILSIWPNLKFEPLHSIIFDINLESNFNNVTKIRESFSTFSDEHNLRLIKTNSPLKNYCRWVASATKEIILNVDKTIKSFILNGHSFYLMNLDSPELSSLYSCRPFKSTILKYQDHSTISQSISNIGEKFGLSYVHRLPTYNYSFIISLPKNIDIMDFSYKLKFYNLFIMDNNLNQIKKPRTLHSLRHEKAPNKVVTPHIKILAANQKLVADVLQMAKQLELKAEVYMADYSKLLSNNIITIKGDVHTLKKFPDGKLIIPSGEIHISKVGIDVRATPLMDVDISRTMDNTNITLKVNPSSIYEKEIIPIDIQLEDSNAHTDSTAPINTVHTESTSSIIMDVDNNTPMIIKKVGNESDLPDQPILDNNNCIGNEPSLSDHPNEFAESELHDNCPLQIVGRKKKKTY